MKIIQILQNWTAESAKIKILFGAQHAASEVPEAGREVRR